MRIPFSVSLLLSGLMLGGAALAQATVLAPNANLLTQGVPAIPQSLADSVARYTDFRGHSFVDWHPTQREMLVSHRKSGANTNQLFRLRSPQGELEQLTDASDPVSEASYEPKTGRYIVFERANGGNEVGQLYRLDSKGAAPVLLSNPDERNNMLEWLNHSSQLIYNSVPVDRTAQGGSRASVNTTLWLTDPEKPEGRRKLAELPGGGWFGGTLSHDDKQFAITRYLSANESEIWLLDLASGATHQLLPPRGRRKPRPPTSPAASAVTASSSG